MNWLKRWRGEKMGKTKIRFKGYTEDWEQRKVLDLLIQPITDGPHETPKLVEKGVPFISVDAIVDNKIDFNRKRGNISEEYDELCCKKYKPQFHDVYLVKSGSTVGKVAIVETTDRFNIWSPLAAMRCGEKTYPYFLYDLLQTKDLQAQVADKASNGTQPNLSMRELEKFPVSVPSNLEEQKKIGDYFRSLDHLITLHQRKCDEAKKLKKCMLQKMFPKDGEKVPEIRFSGFTGDWKQRKLGEIIEVCSGRDYKHLEKGNVPVYGTGGYMLSVSKALSADKDAVGIGRKGTIDKPYILKAPFWTVDTLFYCVSKEDCDLNFIFDIFQNINWKALDESTGVPSLSKAVINKVKVLIPSVVEQIKIGKYFSLLDNRITFHHRKSNLFNKTCRNAWEQRKFGDLGSVAMCKRVFKEQTTPVGEIPFYKIGTFGAEPDAFISRELFEEYKSKFQYPNVGDMLISASGTIGRTVEYSGEEAYFQDSNIVWFKHDDRIDNSFLRCIYNIVKWNGIEGSTIKRLYNDNFLKTEFYMPTTGEQAKIGAYFRSLDHLITLHQRKCNQLQIIRKYMLKNMFL